MATIKKRKIEIIVFERERIVLRASPVRCPVCMNDSEMLTSEQAAALVHVEVQTIGEWLAEGKAHAIHTAGGQRRVCRDSLFII